jgi:hypothetical protein
VIQREVTDRGQLRWSCVQAHGRVNEAELAAELVTDDKGMVPVVCTPTGGAQSVRVELPPSSVEDLPEGELLAAIARACR